MKLLEYVETKLTYCVIQFSEILANVKVVSAPFKLNKI